MWLDVKISVKSASLMDKRTDSEMTHFLLHNVRNKVVKIKSVFYH